MFTGMPQWIDPIPGLKRQVADELLKATGEVSQHFAAAILHATQSRVSDLRRGNLETMSLERMIQMLSRTRRVVEMRISKPARPQMGRPAMGRTESSYPELDNRE